MRSVLLVIAPILLFFITSCGGDKDIDFSQLSVPNEIKVTYGNGQKLTIKDEAVIEKIISDLRKNQYNFVDKPDGVGDNFTLILSDDLRYGASGHLLYKASYYKAQNKELVLEINDYVMSLKQEKE